MKKNIRKLLIPLLLVIILTGFSIVLAEGVQPGFVPEPVDGAGLDGSHKVNAAEIAETESFWTQEKFDAAIPMDMIDEGPVIVDESEIDYSLPETRFAGSPPNRDAIEWAKEQYPMEWLAVANSIEKSGGDDAFAGLDVVDGIEETGDTRYQPYPPPFSRFFISKVVKPWTTVWWRYPWSTMGRLYFKIPGDSSTYVCSASVFYRRAVWTAGHCVYTPGKGYHTNMVFQPGYRRSVAPYGTWTVINANTLTGWTSSSNLAYDIGVVIVADKSGVSIANVVGALGTSVNSSIQRHWHRFGYPANFASGKYLTSCQGSLSATRSKSGPDPIGMGCDMLGGSSGGPYVFWYAPFYHANNNFVNSVHSFHITGKNYEGYGPYFGSGAVNLYNWAITK